MSDPLAELRDALTEIEQTLCAGGEELRWGRKALIDRTRAALQSLPAIEQALAGRDELLAELKGLAGDRRLVLGSTRRKRISAVLAIANATPPTEGA